MAITCRHCRSSDVRLSRTLRNQSVRKVYRCRSCGRHFHHGIDFVVLLGRAGIAGVLVCLLIALGAILYVIF